MDDSRADMSEVTSFSASSTIFNDSLNFIQTNNDTEKVFYSTVDSISDSFESSFDGSSSDSTSLSLLSSTARVCCTFTISAACPSIFSTSTPDVETSSCSWISFEAVSVLARSSSDCKSVID